MNAKLESINDKIGKFGDGSVRGDSRRSHTGEQQERKASDNQRSG
jgi:hypothetical protein